MREEICQRLEHSVHVEILKLEYLFDKSLKNGSHGSKTLFNEADSMRYCSSVGLGNKRALILTQNGWYI